MNTAWSHFNPVRIISGPGVIDDINTHINPGTWLFITTNGAIRRGTVDYIKNKITTDHKLLIEDSITSNPDLIFLDKLNQKYRNHCIDGIIALGGGSAIDAAKILSVTLPAAAERPLHESLIINKSQKWDTCIPVIAIPTTAGTGAEVTPFATVWDFTNHKKYSITGQNVYPNLALLDPNLTTSLSREQTLYTGLDATSHALESIWNKNSTILSEAFAWNALSIISKFFLITLKEQENLNARNAMQQASTLAGLAISQTRTAIAHSISYPLTSHYQVPHGLACSFTLPYLIKENLKYLENNKKIVALEILNILTEIDIKSEIKKYIDHDISHLYESMKSPERSGNYKNKIDINKIINNSIF